MIIRKCSNVIVKVYLTDPPLYNKKRHSYTKKFCSIGEAQEYIESSKMAHINFNNFMGYCSRIRRFFKMELKTKKEKPTELHYIEPQFARQW